MSGLNSRAERLCQGHYRERTAIGYVKRKLGTVELIFDLEKTLRIRTSETINRLKWVSYEYDASCAVLIRIDYTLHEFVLQSVKVLALINKQNPVFPVLYFTDYISPQHIREVVAFVNAVRFANLGIRDSCDTLSQNNRKAL